jgi:hypothetical protein
MKGKRESKSKRNSLNERPPRFCRNPVSVLDCAHGYQKENQENEKDLDKIEEKRRQEIKAAAGEGDSETHIPCEQKGEASSRTEKSGSEKENLEENEANGPPEGRWGAHQQDCEKPAATGFWPAA